MMTNIPPKQNAPVDSSTGAQIQCISCLSKLTCVESWDVIDSDFSIVS